MKKITLHRQPNTFFFKVEWLIYIKDRLMWKHGLSTADFYQWHTKLRRMDVSLMKRMKELEGENGCS